MTGAFDSSIDSGASSGQNDGNGQEQGNSFNPAFQPLLNELPQDLHAKVVPHLQNWDKGVTQKFQTVQQEYEPWKPIIKMGVTPDTVQAGLNLVNMLETNPEALYKAMVDYYKFGQDQDSTSQGPSKEQQQEEDPYKDRFAQMERGFNTLAEHVIQQRQQEENAKADAALEQEFKAAKDKYGEIFDEQWIQSRCLADPNLSVMDAAGMYQQWYQQQAAKFGAKPLIMGGGGGLPQNTPDPTKMTGQETRGLVAQMIELSKQQNRG
jgi:hypothetical protein